MNDFLCAFWQSFDEPFEVMTKSMIRALKNDSFLIVNLVVKGWSQSLWVGFVWNAITKLLQHCFTLLLSFEGLNFCEINPFDSPPTFHSFFKVQLIFCYNQMVISQFIDNKKNLNPMHPPSKKNQLLVLVVSMMKTIRGKLFAISYLCIWKTQFQ